MTVKTGNLLDDPAPILVCPVNCRPGVMGAGLAKQFAERFPSLRGRHRSAASRRWIRVGRCGFIENVAMPAPVQVRLDEPGYGELDLRHVVLFPTKDDWRKPTLIEWIWDGLADLRCMLVNLIENDGRFTRPFDIAMPALGCGLGGLDYGEVQVIIRAWEYTLPKRINVILYEPPDWRTP